MQVNDSWFPIQETGVVLCRYGGHAGLQYSISFGSYLDQDISI